MAQLDHIILLLPHQDVLNAPAWLTDNFTISPGGAHADGKTENKLILFADGTYLELIAFVNDDPAKRAGHWWDRDFGVIDYALTTAPVKPLDHDALQARLKQTETRITYAAPQAGARRKPDGTEIKWEVTFPQGAPRGAVPFWCHDVTERRLRVPVSEESTRHVCGVTGVGGVVIEVEESQVSRLKKATGAILEATESEVGGVGSFGVGTPIEVAGSREPAVKIQKGGEREGKDGLPSLTLLLQGPKEVPTIRKEVSGGLVSIGFEISSVS